MVIQKDNPLMLVQQSHPLRRHMEDEVIPNLQGLGAGLLALHIAESSGAMAHEDVSALALILHRFVTMMQERLDQVQQHGEAE